MEKNVFYKLLPVIVFISAILTLIVNAIITSTWDWETVSKITFINFLVYTLLYYFLEKVSTSSSLKWFFNKPILKGTWIGVIRSEKDARGYPFMIQISQSIWSISVKTISSRNLNSYSKTCSIIKENQNYRLYYTWSGKNADRVHPFNGTTMLEINIKENEMNGKYYSENINGHISLQRHSHVLLDRYKTELFTDEFVENFQNKLPKAYE